MKKNALMLVLLLALGGFLASCDSENEVQCPEDFTGALTAEEAELLGTWTLTAIASDTAIDMTDDGEDNPNTDFFAQYGECQKDASYTFGPNRAYTFDQAQHGENCQNKLTLKGSWKLSSDQLGLVSGCSLQNNAIEMAEDGSSFTFSGQFSVRDATGQIKSAKISFTYTRTA